MQHARVILSQYLGPVSDYLADPTVSEVMINRPDDVWIERNGLLESTDAVFEPNALRGAIKVLGRMVGRDVSDDGPDAILDAHLDELRVGAVLAPVSQEGDAISIRKHGRSGAPLESFFQSGYEARKPGSDVGHIHDPRQFLCDLVRSKANILIAGGTSSGKTTFMNALLREIPSEERLITIEDTAELLIQQPNRVRLIAKPRQGIDIQALLRLSLRMRPDRIVVGEVRGAEAFDLLQAWNTGHDGGCASIHASSPEGALRRLETLVLTANTGWPLEAIRHAVANTVDYVVHLGRHRGKRCVLSITKVELLDMRYKLTEMTI